MSLWINCYDDIFSDFDLRAYASRNISDDFLRELLADPVNILERDDDALVGRDVDACDTGHCRLHVGRTPGAPAGE